MADEETNLTTESTEPERATAALTPNESKQATFKVKLEPTHEDEAATVQGFTYVDGDGFGHWALGAHGYEVEFSDLNTARAFMTAAIATKGIAVASDSPTKLK